ncbi:NEAT domain-containing protein [Viridibacillus sp. YIM B01967]|uniref:NEAT domain-containing protein n=1 Tax=Viridibacillus soli TaxID=2798301 RepID=A0ABS1H5U7_9BACL|nr:NEAT domain-containing protein [Viridibacillus soli]MBK3494797.1 NEAT domain-containing protein [Viridibacillus soli]
MKQLVKIALIIALIFSAASIATPQAQAATTTTLNAIKQGQYTVPIQFLTDGTSKSSVMNTYVNPTAKLVVKNGKQYVQITLKNSDWITGLKVNTNGKLTKPKTISTNKKKKEKVVQFEAKDITTKLNAWVKVDAAKYNYHHKYNVQIKFDSKNVKNKSGKKVTIKKPKTTKR